MSRKTTSTARGARDSKEKFWRRTLGRFAASGQSVRGFCRVHGLSEPSFYAWRRRLKQRDAERLAAAGSAGKPVPDLNNVTRDGQRSGAAARPAPAFLPVRLSQTSQGRMEIVLNGGARIRLRGPVDRSALAEVVAVLRAAGEEG